MTRRAHFLVAALAAVAGATDLLVRSGPGLVVAGVVVAAAPGIIIAALLSDALDLGVLGKGAVAAASSLGLCILGAFALNVAGGLNRTSWVILLSAVTLLGTAAALARTPAAAREAVGAPPPAPAFWRHVSTRTALLVLAAASLATAAVVLSVESDLHRSSPAFTELWLVPRLAHGTTRGSAQLGVRDDEGRATTYRLVLQIDGEKSSAWTFRLATGAARTWTVPVSVSERLAAELYCSSGGRWAATPCRQVHAIAGLG